MDPERRGKDGGGVFRHLVESAMEFLGISDSKNALGNPFKSELDQEKDGKNRNADRSTQYRAAPFDAPRLAIGALDDDVLDTSGNSCHWVSHSKRNRADPSFNWRETFICSFDA